jgi:hypothetical protein
MFIPRVSLNSPSYPVVSSGELLDTNAHLSRQQLREKLREAIRFARTQGTSVKQTSKSSFEGRKPIASKALKKSDIKAQKAAARAMQRQVKSKQQPKFVPNTNPRLQQGRRP